MEGQPYEAQHSSELRQEESTLQQASTLPQVQIPAQRLEPQEPHHPPPSYSQQPQLQPQAQESSNAVDHTTANEETPANSLVQTQSQTQTGGSADTGSGNRFFVHDPQIGHSDIQPRHAHGPDPNGRDRATHADSILLPPPPAADDHEELPTYAATRRWGKYRSEREYLEALAAWAHEKEFMEPVDGSGQHVGLVGFYGKKSGADYAAQERITFGRRKKSTDERADGSNGHAAKDDEVDGQARRSRRSSIWSKLTKKRTREDGDEP